MLLPPQRSRSEHGSEGAPHAGPLAASPSSARTRPRRRLRLGGRVLPAVAQFAITGLLAVVLLGAIGVHLLRQTGTSEAIRNAEEVTRLAGDGIVGPSIVPGVLTGKPAAIAGIDRLVRKQILRPPVVRIKIWDAGGRILYSDEPRLIGARYQLRGEELAALMRGGTQAEVSDLSRPENRLERGQKKLLEVYHGIRTPSGQRLLFETYLRFSSVAASGQRLWLRFAPALVGALLLLEIAQIPLAVSLARRVRRGQQERESLLRRAIDASELERKRIARDLHDSVVQNLIGVSYRLAAAAERMGSRGGPSGAGDPSGRGGGDRSLGEAVEQAATETRRSIRELRTLLVDIYPPDLHRAGLEAALRDLMAPFAGHQIQTELTVAPDLPLPPHAEALLFRAAQEALRNVLAHSAARRVSISVSMSGGIAALTVEDDGGGFDPDATIGTGSKRHFGLRILRDLAQDANGDLTINSAVGRGTRVRVEVPVL